MLFGTNDNDFIEIGNGSDDSCGEFDSSVSLINFEDVVAGCVLFLNVFFHIVIDFISSEVHLKLGESLRSLPKV